MRFFAAILFALYTSLSFAIDPPATSSSVAPEELRYPLLEHAKIIEGTPLQQDFLDQEKVVFQGDMPVRPFDVEDDHVWAAKKWVEALISPASSEEEFIAGLWGSGQQIAALQRQNKIYIRSRGSPKWASYVFEREIEKQLKKYCSGKVDPKSCTSTLKEKALKLTEIFWGDFKKQAEDDFKKNGLDKKRIGFHQIRGHIRDAFRNSQSNAWIAMNDYMEAFKASNAQVLVPFKREIVVPGRPMPITPGYTLPASPHSKTDIAKAIDRVKKKIVTKLGLEPKIKEVPEERRAWNYVDSNSQSYDMLRASSRYVDQVVQSLGCGYFNESSLLNGQIIARLLRKGSMDVAKLTEMTNRSVESWCYSQFTNAEKIIACKSTLAPQIAELNKYYWSEVKSSLEATKKNPTSADVDNFFANLKNKNAVLDPSHPLGKIHLAISDSLQKIKGDWDYQCLSVKEEALGDYRILKATAEQKAVADNLLRHLMKSPLRSPPGYCARSVKTAMQASGIFRTYPDWGNATSMAKGFENENLKHIFLDEGYELQRLDTMDPAEAPAYALIVYGNGDGHVEMKVPTSELLARGIHTMLGYGQKQIAVQDREFAYVSDYIDSAPRNSPKSRIARGDGSNNGRPVLGIYAIMRKS